MMADIPAAFMAVAAAWCFRDWLPGSSAGQAQRTFGLALGLAELTKTTLLVLYPVFAVIAAVDAVVLGRRGPRPFGLRGSDAAAQ